VINDVHPLHDGVVLRPVTPADAENLARAYVRNREHLAHWEPVRGEEFFTAHGQADVLERGEQERLAGHQARWVLADADGEIVGSMTLGSISRGPFSSAGLGYWIDGALNGRGLATAAVRQVCRIADLALRLHRVQAGTLLDNAGSQRVLAKSGFEPIGVAPAYLHIAGRWQDHRLFQRILNDREPGELVGPGGSAD
jgi:ribosomal-protein-alanine N-acetyltransferase